MFRNIKLPPEFKALEDMLHGKILMSGAAAIIGASLAAVGVTMNLIQAGKQKRMQQKASDEAAKAIARARMAVTKNIALERAIPTVSMDNLLKAAAQQQKQVIEGLRASGQRAVVGGIPQVGAASERVMEKMRGKTEKELLAREDLVAAQQIAQDQQQLNLIAAEGTGARMQEARAAQARALALSGAAKSASKAVMAVMGNEDINKLFGAEAREYRKGIEGLLEGTTDIDRDSFEEYLNTVQVDDGTGSGKKIPATQEQLLDMMNNPDNTLINDYIIKSESIEVDILTPKIDPLVPTPVDA